ncbi:hypothetical protein FFLO_06067 [Filobasidium floriforme]|uniref:Major facilitator superfamily (MFS) profile domain-containing protein n=1 Tax=Filobasidium floriforme TaxID=5210 RepID=A0A8K0JG38_9TREE|nr:hypothetical protein FFLO_06067 [Filobasidium floriforme]
MTSYATDDKDKIYTEHSENAISSDLEYRGGQTGNEKQDAQYLADAIEATKEQKDQGFKSAFSQYGPAMLWSIVFSSAIIMEGYDTLLLGQFYAQPAFARRFGKLNPVKGIYEIPTKWQTSLGVSTQIGNILGLQITGWASERFGYRITMLVALICLTGFLFIQFFAANLGMLLAGYLLLGVSLFAFQTLTVSYAADVMPVRLRQYLTTYVNLCWVIGQIISSGVNRALVGNETEWAYKIPFAIQWVWVLPIGLGIAFAPESPWWLTKKGRFADAERSLMRLTSRGSGFTEDDAKKQVAMMDHTNQLEMASTSGVQFTDCFKGTNLRRTEIACIVWLVQQLCGSPLMGNATYFLKQAGLSESTASTLNLIMFAIGAIGTVSSWWLMQFAGRRTIYLWGSATLNVLMLVTGVLGTIKSKGDGKNYATGAILILFTGLYDLTVGPVCYSLVAEIGSTRLRAKTVILARNLYNIGGLVINIINPYMLNSTAWNLAAKSGYVWFGTGILGTIWVFFRLPEPAGRTYGELDILFERKIPARLFSKTEVDEFEAAERDAANNAAGGGHAIAH